MRLRRGSQISREDISLPSRGVEDFHVILRVENERPLLELIGQSSGDKLFQDVPTTP